MNTAILHAQRVADALVNLGHVLHKYLPVLAAGTRNLLNQEMADEGDDMQVLLPLPCCRSFF